MGNILVDLQNKDVKRYVAHCKTLPADHPVSPWHCIPLEQFALYTWAVAYENMEPLVTDHIYDMHTRYLQRQQIMFPDIWADVSLECFKDGSWVYTGMFITNHDLEDEQWLL